MHRSHPSSSQCHKTVGKKPLGNTHAGYEMHDAPPSDNLNLKQLDDHKVIKYATSCRHENLTLDI